MRLKLIILYIMFFMITGCGKNTTKIEQSITTEETTNKENIPKTSGSCGPDAVTFFQGITYHSNYRDVYIIKGIVLEKIEHGLKIELKIGLVEDLKGNFPENISTLIVWGGGSYFLEDNRLDNLSLYDKQDTLIMLLTTPQEMPAEMIPPEYTWLEKPEDYTTLPCTFSVLKLSDDYVEGYILPPDDGIHIYINSTMLFEDFQKKLNELLKIK